MQHQRARIVASAGAHGARHGSRHATPMPPAAIIVIIIMSGKTRAKPASASVPSRPKMKVSAMATKVCAIITAVVGAESFQRLEPIGAVRRGWDRGGSRLCAYAPYQPAPSCHLTNPAGIISFWP